MGEPMKRLWLAIALCASLLVPASAQVPVNQGVTTVPGIPITASSGNVAAGTATATLAAAARNGSRIFAGSRPRPAARRPQRL
jgi:hypothetical protein